MGSIFLSLVVGDFFLKEFLVKVAKSFAFWRQMKIKHLEFPSFLQCLVVGYKIPHSYLEWPLTS